MQQHVGILYQVTDNYKLKIGSCILYKHGGSCRIWEGFFFPFQVCVKCKGKMFLKRPVKFSMA